MAATSEFATYCAEMLGVLGRTRIKRMFGGHGFYVDEVFIALAMNDRLYLKTDLQTQPAFRAAGCEPFVFHMDGKPTSLSYWTPPDEAMESPALLLPWARLAMEAALRKLNAKPVPRKKAGKAESKKAGQRASTRPKAAPATKLKPAPAASAKTPSTPTKKRAAAKTKR